MHRDRCLIVMQRANVPVLFIVPPKGRSERRFVQEESVIKRKARTANVFFCQVVVGQVGVPALVTEPRTRCLKKRALLGDVVAQKMCGVHGDCSLAVVFQHADVPALILLPNRRSRGCFTLMGGAERKARAGRSDRSR